MHTPGPWTHDAGDTCAIVYQETSGTIATIPMDLHNFRANARLIAAAPALLQALLDALPYVEDVLSDPAALACFKPGTVERHAKAIRAAISAATED